MLKEVALLSPIYVTLFWGLVFIVKDSKKDLAKFNLGIFMLFAFLLYCSHAVFFSKHYILYSYFETIYIFTMLSVFPLYFTYVLSLTGNRKVLKESLKRFIPAVCFALLALLLTFFMDPQERVVYVKEILMNKNLKGLELNTMVGMKGLVFFSSRIIFLIQVGYFGVKGIWFANTHNKQLEDYYSNTEGKTLDWVKTVNVVIIFAAVASFTFALIGRSYFSKHEVSLLVPSAIFSSFFFFIGVKGNTQLQINSEFVFEGNDRDIGEINSDQNEKLKEELVELFERKQIYKNPELRITHVSEQLKSNRTYISKLINIEFNMNFNDFVNNYRITEAKELFKCTDDKLNTMEYIAEKSGFGSVNSFTRAFKKHTGVTPGHFRMNGYIQN